MSNIAIQKYRETGDVPFFAEVRSLFDQIRERAYALFQRRGGATGGDLNDWLAAERELLWSPPAELTERDGVFHVRVAVPGFDAKEVQAAATPDCIEVNAVSGGARETKEGHSHFSEFAERMLFRRIDLPEPIDVDKVKATLDKGILELTAEKAAKPKPKNIAATA